MSVLNVVKIYLMARLSHLHYQSNFIVKMLVFFFFCRKEVFIYISKTSDSPSHSKALKTDPKYNPKSISHVKYKGEWVEISS